MRYLFLSIAIFSTVGNGQSLRDSINRCSSIDSDLARLLCYDELVSDSTSNHQALDPENGAWEVLLDEDPITDKQRFFLTLESENAVSSLGVPVRLVVRCIEGGDNDVFVQWHEYLGDTNPSVTTRLGDARPRQERWGLSNDRQATFVRKNQLLLIEKFLYHDRYVAKVTPYRENPITATFDLSGFQESLQEHAYICGKLIFPE